MKLAVNGQLFNYNFIDCFICLYERGVVMNIKYFTCANSCKGLINLTESNIKGIGRVYSIKSSSLKRMSNFIKQVGEYFESRNTLVEYILNASDKSIYDGCIIKDMNVILFNSKTFDKGIEINLGTTEDYVWLEEKIQSCYDRMYVAFGEAKKIHDDWEKIYIGNMDFEKLNSFKKKSIDQMFNAAEYSENASVNDRFFGGSTKDGYVNLIDDLTRGIKNRYFIKGRPGTGKSTFMKEVANEAEKHGLDVIVYKCSFDPDSLDMVVVPHGEFCVFDSTAPHEMFPTKAGDRVLDFYKESGLVGVDEKYKKILDEISAEYRLRLNEGNEHLKLSAVLGTELENKLERINFDDFSVSEFVTKIKNNQI